VPPGQQPGPAGSEWAPAGSERGPAGEIDGAAWRAVLGLAPGEQPVAVVVEGTWWRAQATKRRLARIDPRRELGVPDLFIGRWAGHDVLYAAPYGAPRTAEIIHIAASIGVALGIQLGSCGVVGPGVAPGDVIVPNEARGLDGVTALYTPNELVAASVPWASRAAAALTGLGISVHRGRSVTWPTLFNQPLDTVRAWRADGYLGVDMETATTFAVAEHFGVAAVSMLVAWDEVLSGRSFLDPLSASDQAAFDRADEAIWDVALSLVAEQSDA